eukprot:Opistho-1_new@69054
MTTMAPVSSTVTSTTLTSTASSAARALTARACASTISRRRVAWALRASRMAALINGRMFARKLSSESPVPAKRSCTAFFARSALRIAGGGRLGGIGGGATTVVDADDVCGRALDVGATGDDGCTCDWVVLPAADESLVAEVATDCWREAVVVVCDLDDESTEGRAAVDVGATGGAVLATFWLDDRTDTSMGADAEDFAAVADATAEDDVASTDFVLNEGCVAVNDVGKTEDAAGTLDERIGEGLDEEGCTAVEEGCWGCDATDDAAELLAAIVRVDDWTAWDDPPPTAALVPTLVAALVGTGCCRVKAVQLPSLPRTVLGGQLSTQMPSKRPYAHAVHCAGDGPLHDVGVFPCTLR